MIRDPHRQPHCQPHCHLIRHPHRSRQTPSAALHRAGMTLIELTVGIVVTGLIVSAGYAAFATIIDQRERAMRVAMETAHAVELHRTLLHWLDNATIQQRSNVLSTSGTGDEVTFETTARTTVGMARTPITLYVSLGSAGSSRGLFALLPPQGGGFRSFNSRSSSDSLRVLLDSTIRQMSVEYLVAANGSRQWQTQDMFAMTQSSRTPLAIRLRLISDDPAVATIFSQPVVAPLMGRL